MLALRRLPPAALAGVSVGLGLMGAQSALAIDQPGRLGKFRTDLGELSQGLTISIAEGIRYESNLVRTANDAETIALYGTDDASDIISQTSLNISYRTDTSRLKINFAGDVSYAKYFEFDQFSGLVTGGSGSIDWQFTNRCSTGISARAERRVADFSEVVQATANVQHEFGGTYSLGCFILDRFRLSGSAFGDSVRNEDTARQFADADHWGYSVAAALVSKRRNEIGVRFTHAETDRPNNPATPEVTNERVEGYLRFMVGNHLDVGVAAGGEQVSRPGLADTDRSTASGDLSWTPSSRLSASVNYTRQTEDTTDLVGTTSETDRIGGNVSWQLNRVSLGGFAQYEDSRLNGGVLTGVTEQRTTAGVSLQHSLFQLINVRWTAGYIRRDSNNALREFDGINAGVSLGLAL